MATEIAFDRQPQSCCIEVLVIESQTIFRAGICNVLSREPDIQVVGGAAETGEAIQLARRLRPGILLLDFCAPPPFGLEMLRGVADYPEIRTLVLATAAEKGNLGQALRLGARGVVLKNSAAHVLIRGIRTVVRGVYWIHDREVPDIDAALRAVSEPLARLQPKKTFGLTRRELQVISSIVAGYSNREIARELSISNDTVKHHLTNIYDKVGVYNRLELALFAMHHGLTAQLQPGKKAD